MIFNLWLFTLNNPFLAPDTRVFEYRYGFKFDKIFDLEIANFVNGTAVTKNDPHIFRVKVSV
jgi:hypothetical protein